MGDMTDQDLNEAVAQKLNARPDYYVGTTTPIYPDYCHSIEAAWEIVEHCRKEDFAVRIESDFSMDFYRVEICNTTDHDVKCNVADADTAPLAIVKAFLALP